MAKVVKMAQLDLATISVEAPVLVDTKSRSASVAMPMLQTAELTYTLSGDGGSVEVLCDNEQAEKIHEIDGVLIATIADSSEDWFGRKINIDQVERMFRPTLQGNRNPRQVLNASKLKFFDNQMKPCDTFPPAGSAMFIMRLDDIHFEEKVCEARWSLVQAKEAIEVAASPANDPMFVS